MCSDPQGAKSESAEDGLFTPPKNRRTRPSEATTTDGSTIKHKRKRVVQLASSSDEDCQNDVTCQNRPSVTTFNSSVVDTSRSCMKMARRSNAPEVDSLSCKPRQTTCSSSVAKSHSTVTSSRHSHIGQDWNDSRQSETRLPLMSHGNMTTSDRGMTSPATRVQSDVGNQGNISRVVLLHSVLFF